LRADDIDARRQAGLNCAELIGIESVEFEDYPNLRLYQESLLGLTQKIEARLDRWQLDIVYTHHSSDTNIDHRLVFDATLVAARPIPGKSIASIRCFEIGSSTDYSVPSLGHPFLPNLDLDVTQWMDTWFQMVDFYGTEMRPAPFPRSKEVLAAGAILRGSEVGLARAEAFMEVRRIIK
jgi:N-acetylglucosamine malate deacetylase 1